MFLREVCILFKIDMTVLLILLLLIMALVVFLVFTPVSLRIDTYRKEYYVQVWGVIRAWLEWDRGPILKLRVPFYVIRLDPLAPAHKKEKKPAIKKRRARRKRHRGGTTSGRFMKVSKLIRSFRVREFKLELDTGDVVQNAYWYPLFFHLNRLGKGTWQVNFAGHNGMILHLENRAIRVLWALIN